MRIPSVLLILLSGTPLFGAPGDIKWASVENNGWVLQVDVDTGGPNGTFDFGF